MNFAGNPIRVGNLTDRVVAINMSIRTLCMTISKLNVILIHCLLPHSLKAQPYFFTNYTIENGLSNMNVTGIIKDKEGFIWVATHAGLNRFDGYDFTVYKSQAGDSTSLNSNTLNELFVDHEGTLWISSFYGINSYKKSENNFIQHACITAGGESRKQFEAFSVFEDNQNQLWATTHGIGLLKYNKRDKTFIQWTGKGNETSAKWLSGNRYILKGMQDKREVYWLAERNSITRYDPLIDSLTEYKLTSGSRSMQVLTAEPDPSYENRIWIGTWGDGLICYDKKTGKYAQYLFQKEASVNLSNIVFDIHFCDNSKIWLATNTGVIPFDINTFSFQKILEDKINEKRVINSQIQCIYRDEEAIIWFGGLSGLCNINPRKQYFISHPVWVPSHAYKFIDDTSSQKLYGISIYNNRALLIYDKKKKTNSAYPIPGADRIQAEPFSIMKDRQGLIWIGTTKGVFIFNEQINRFEPFQTPAEWLKNNESLYATEIFEDKKGQIWIADYRFGLIRYDKNNKDTQLFPINKISSSDLRIVGPNKIVQGNGDSFFILGDGNGVSKYIAEKNRFENYISDDEHYRLLTGCTDMTYDAHSSALWVTTKNNGLIRIDESGRAVAYIRDEAGNLIDEQRSIVTDNYGNIWLNANSGLYCFNTSSNKLELFTHQEGRPDNLTDQVLNKLPDGSIAYQFSAGIYSFYPDEVLNKERPLTTCLKSFHINGKPAAFSSNVNRQDTIRLNHTENNFTVEFAAINFTNPFSTLYSYKLEGVDKTWSVSSRTRTVNFSQLNPGNYVLRIRAGENSPEKVTHIIISPAWWQTSVFKLMVFFFLLTILILSTRFFFLVRLKQKIAAHEREREIERVRSRISRDLHDEIGSGLTKIKLMSRNLSKAQATADWRESSSKISSASDELIKSLGEIVWTINPANDSLKNIIAFMRNYTARLFEEKPEVSLQLEFPESERIPDPYTIHPEVKQCLLMVLKESLNNLLKHSLADEAKVELKLGVHELELMVSDNGIGIETQPEVNYGIGLISMKSRTELAGGEFSAGPSGEWNTEVHIKLPIK